MRARSPYHRVIGDEPRLTYNRVLLSSVLDEKPAPADIDLSRCRGGAILPLKHRERHRSSFHRRSAPRIDEVIEQVGYFR